jgi:hypothetical protein
MISAAIGSGQLGFSKTCGNQGPQHIQLFACCPSSIPKLLQFLLSIGCDLLLLKTRSIEFSEWARHFVEIQERPHVDNFVRSVTGQSEHDVIRVRERSEALESWSAVFPTGERRSLLSNCLAAFEGGFTRRRRPIISETTQSEPLLRFLRLIGPEPRPTRFRHPGNLRSRCSRHSPLLSGWFVIDDLCPERSGTRTIQRKNSSLNPFQLLLQP